MLDVMYGEIRSNVIARLFERREEMVGNLNNLKDVVMSLRQYMEGDAREAYIKEFDEVVQRIYDKLNQNLEKYAEQLESVCKEFEKMDAELKDQLS